MAVVILVPTDEAELEVNDICVADTAVNGAHTLTISGTTTGATDDVTVSIVITGANPQTTALPTVTAAANAWTTTFVYPSGVSGVATGARPNKGDDTIVITAMNISELPTVNTDVATVYKSWQKALLYMHADGTWSTEPQDEYQDPGCASNSVGQGRGIVTPHKDIVAIYCEYVLEFVDALIASGKSRAAELAVACEIPMPSLAAGQVIKKNYHGITTPVGQDYNAGFLPVASAMGLLVPVNDVVITPTLDNSTDAIDYLNGCQMPVGTTGYSSWWCIDDVCCVIGAVLDTLIWYPCTGYNPQIGDYIYLQDAAGNAMLKWPMASNNPQLRVPLLLRGLESVETIITAPTTTTTGLKTVCTYGKYRWKVRLAVPVAQSHTFRIETAGLKIVTVESQRSSCVDVVIPQLNVPQSEADNCHEAC
jgi:hypothetical protein